MSFANNVSIWNLLKTVETEKGVVLLSVGTKKLKDGKIGAVYSQPIVNVLTTELASNTELRKTTLSTLGVKSGSVVLRVRFKVTDVALSEFLESDAALALQEADDARASEQRIADAKVAQALHIKEQQAKLAQTEEQSRRDAEQRERETLRLLAEQQAKDDAAFMGSLALAQQESLRTYQSASSSNPSASSMDVDSPTTSTKKSKFEVVVEPPGPPGLLNVLLEGGMIDEDHSRLHEVLRQARDQLAVANQIPAEPCDRAVLVYAPSNKPFDPSTLEIPDDFFDVSPEDASKSKPARESDALKTKAMRDRERLQKLARFKKCFVRFRFPDRMELQGTFYPQEGFEHLVAFIREHLADPNLHFHLFTTPPTTPVHPTKNLRDQNFLPAALVQVGLDKDSQTVSPFLKKATLELIEEKSYSPVVREYKSTMEIKMVTPQTQEAASSSGMDVDHSPASGHPHDAQSGSGHPPKDSKKVPKWFAAGMKKK